VCPRVPIAIAPLITAPAAMIATRIHIPKSVKLTYVSVSRRRTYLVESTDDDHAIFDKSTGRPIQDRRSRSGNRNTGGNRKTRKEGSYHLRDATFQTRQFSKAPGNDCRQPGGGCPSGLVQ